MPDRYAARVIDVPNEGIRLEPTPESVTPEQPTEINLLGMAIARALGAAAYEHHPAARNPQARTIEALLAGEATMPWCSPRDGTPAARERGTVPYVVCERAGTGVFVCGVRYRAVDADRP
ncbi:hypothetical protein [Streptomyces sp. NPDC051219]|uniref:hypothetical protein n=1 Tax=Streptomyces sp. NPDC051219 TaxID=3155283 RepID=UPI0034226D83